MEEHSFDDLAKEMVAGTISRGQALKLVGGAVLGVFGLASLPRPAEAKKKKKKKKKKRKHHSAASPPPTPPACQPFGMGCPTTCTCQGTCQQIPIIGSICIPSTPTP
jgi:hypothetical protein